MTFFKRSILPLMGAILALSAPAYAKDFRLGLITPPPHVWTKAAKAFGQELHRKSNGAHTVSVFPSRQLGNEAQMIQMLQTGSLDMAFLTIAEVSNRVPDFGAFYAPYLVKNVEEAASLLRSQTAKFMMTTLPQQIGVVGMGFGMGGLRQIVARDDISSAEDLKGKKVRITPFEPIKDFYSALETAPTPMPLPAVYNALANGQVDAIDMDVELILKLKYYEQAKTVILSNHMMFPMIGLVSAKVWRGLSQDDRTLIEDVMARHLDSIIDTYVKIEGPWLQAAEALDIKVLTPDTAFLAKATTKWEEKWGEKAPILAKFKEEMKN